MAIVLLRQSLSVSHFGLRLLAFEIIDEVVGWVGVVRKNSPNVLVHLCSHLLSNDVERRGIVGDQNVRRLSLTLKHVLNGFAVEGKADSNFAFVLG